MARVDVAAIEANYQKTLDLLMALKAASHRPSLPNRTRGFLFGASGGMVGV